MFPSRIPPPLPEYINQQQIPPHQNYYNLRRRGKCPMGNDSGGESSGGGGSSGSSGSGLPSDNNTTTNNETLKRIQNKYYPKIYSYKCYGKYTTSSNMYDTSSNNNGGGGGKCYGYAKSIETLYNEKVLMSRIEALQRFTSMNSDIDLDDYNHHHSDNNNSNNNEHNNKSGSGGELSEQAVYLSPALIYQYEGGGGGGTNTTEIKTTKKDETTKVAAVTATTALQYYDDQLLEEEIILEQDWTCYGVTDVEYLSLEDVRTGESKLVAVAPRNTGISKRNIETDDHLRSLTRCSLGWIDILHDSNSVLDYEGVDENEEETENGKKEGKGIDSYEDFARLVNKLKKKNEMNKKNAERATDESSVDEEIRQTPSIMTVLRIPKDVESMMKVGQERMNRAIEFSKLVATHMQYNVQWLYGNLSDDFSNRTMAAGKRCIQEVPKIMDGTVTAMNQVIQHLRRGGGRDDDDDDDDNSPSSGGRRF